VRTVRVLLVEDDPAVGTAVRALLSDHGFEADLAPTGRAGLARLDDGAYDLVILDIVLPDLSGIEVLRELRRFHQVPVLMLTARSASTDKVNGLDAGADDYLVKPFDPPELVARLRALLRRAGKLTTDPVALGRCQLDPSTRMLSLDERSVELTAREVDLLETLASVPGKVWTRSQLVSSVWGYDAEVDDRTVDSVVKRLRRKLEHLVEDGDGAGEDPAGTPAAEGVPAIRTLYGVGYRLDGIRW
jgi:DNA-binding response OmpR family regulator